MTFDCAIIGGGIVGLSTALMLGRRQPRAKILVLEKEPALALHQTGRNSGVIHSGIYYKPGSFKAQFARAGSRSMVEFCREHGLRHEVCGKVIVAADAAELPRLEQLRRRGLENGLDVVQLSAERVQELEPHVRCVAGLHVPSTGIVNYGEVCRRMGELIVGFGIGDLALFQAYPRLGARRTMVLVQCLAAPFGALLEWAWLQRAPTLAQAGFGAVILAGVGVALMPRRADAQPTHGLVAGICFGTLSALCQGGGAVISRKAYEVAAAAGQRFHGVGDGVNAAYQRMLGGLLVSALVLIYLKLAHKPDQERPARWGKAVPWMFANALAGPMLGVTFYQWALMTTPTSLVLPIVATTPLVVMPLAHWLEGEPITKRAVLGGILAVAGVIGLTMSR